MFNGYDGYRQSASTSTRTPTAGEWNRERRGSYAQYKEEKMGKINRNVGPSTSAAEAKNENKYEPKSKAYEQNTRNFRN